MKNPDAGSLKSALSITQILRSDKMDGRSRPIAATRSAQFFSSRFSPLPVFFRVRRPFFSGLTRPVRPTLMTSRHTQVIIPANKDMFMRSPKLSLLLLGILALSLSACSTRHSRPVVQADMRPTVSMNDRQLDNWQSLSARTSTRRSGQAPHLRAFRQTRSAAVFRAHGRQGQGNSIPTNFSPSPRPGRASPLKPSSAFRAPGSRAW